jgi:hypothetical protein
MHGTKTKYKKQLYSRLPNFLISCYMMKPAEGALVKATEAPCADL